MRDQNFYKSPAMDKNYALQTTVTFTEDALLIFFQYGVEKLQARRLGMEPTTLDPSSHSGVYDLSTTFPAYPYLM